VKHSIPTRRHISSVFRQFPFLLVQLTVMQPRCASRGSYDRFHPGRQVSQDDALNAFLRLLLLSHASFPSRIRSQAGEMTRRFLPSLPCKKDLVVGYIARVVGITRVGESFVSVVEGISARQVSSLTLKCLDLLLTSHFHWYLCLDCASFETCTSGYNVVLTHSYRERCRVFRSVKTQTMWIV
jgi:hypothetical protein